MKITIKPAAPPPAPVPVPASTLRPGDRFRELANSIVQLRTENPLGAHTSCVCLDSGYSGLLFGNELVYRLDNDGNPILPPPPEPKVVALSELAVGDVFRYAAPTSCRGYRMKLPPDHTIPMVPFLRLHDTGIGDGDTGYDGESCRVIKVEAELVIEGDR